MSSALAQLPGLVALAVTGAALAAGLLALAVTGRPLVALHILLDLLLAAGLLRLSGDPDWAAIGTAAAIVALRRLIGAGLRAGGGAWSPSPPGPGARARDRHPLAAQAQRLVRPAWRL